MENDRGNLSAFDREPYGEADTRAKLMPLPEFPTPAELRTQAVNALSNVFGSDAAEVYEDAEARNNARNARAHIAT